MKRQKNEWINYILKTENEQKSIYVHEHQIKKNQIHYIISVKKCSVIKAKKAKVDCETDHELLVGKFQIKLNNNKKANQYDLEQTVYF